jgi:hypothetical protein
MTHQEEWLERLKEADEKIELKRARHAEYAKKGDLSPEADKAAKEHREAIDEKAALKEEMQRNARAYTDQKKSEYEKIKDGDARDEQKQAEKARALKEYREAQHEEEQIKQELDRGRSR